MISLSGLSSENLVFSITFVKLIRRHVLFAEREVNEQDVGSLVVLRSLVSHNLKYTSISQIRWI